MDKYTMTEEAYKNGYEAGVKKFAERLKSRLIVYSYQNFNDVIDNLAKELIEHR